MSARCVYQSLLKCGMTLPHQSCKRFDSARVLPQRTAVRVICSGSLQAYGGSWVRYSRRRVSIVFPLWCSSFNRCAVYGDGRLRVSFGATRESECRWLMAKQCCKPPSPFYRPRRAAACKIVCSSSLLYIEGRMRKVEISLQVSYVCENTPKM